MRRRGKVRCGAVRMVVLGRRCSTGGGERSGERVARQQLHQSALAERRVRRVEPGRPRPHGNRDAARAPRDHGEGAGERSKGGAGDGEKGGVLGCRARVRYAEMGATRCALVR